MKKDGRCILVDSREKRPWTFRAQKRVKLEHGDYTILGGKTRIVIERKTLTDLYVTLTPKRWKKFYEKMTIACNTLDHVLLFVEASLSEVYHGISFSRLPSAYIIARIIDLISIGVQVIFTGNSKKGPQFAETVLRSLK